MESKRRGTIYLFLIIMAMSFYSCKEEIGNNPTLYAYFKTNTRGVVAGDSVEFEDESVGHPSSWEWTFEGGDPASSTEENPKVAYDYPGRYNVGLKIATDSRSSEKEMKDLILVVSGKNEVVLDKDLIAYYPFDGSPEDIGPNNLKAMKQGEVTFDGIDRDSKKNSAAVFDGSSALIIPDANAFNVGTSDFSISCWLKTDSTDKMMIWQESGAGGSKDNQAWLRIGDNTTNRLIRFDTEDSGGGSILNYGNGPGTGVANNSWHHLVCVREGATTRLYIDGVKKGELVKSATKDVSSEQDFKIGAQEGPEGSYHTYFTGLLDDLIIYSKALSDNEIKNLYKL